MGKRKIESYDEVQSNSSWACMKDKKEKIKIMSEKLINSEFHLVFGDVTALDTFLYLSLAPEEALGFQKIQPILQKMQGENAEFKAMFEKSRKELNIDWNGEKPLSEEIRRIKAKITQEQKNIYDLSQRIDQEEARQLLKSGLSQIKIHLDYHTSDMNIEEVIIPTIQNVQDFISIIFDESSNRYLLAFMSHIPQQVEQQKEQQKQIKMDIKNEISKNEISKNEINKNEINKNEINKNEINKNEIISKNDKKENQDMMKKSVENKSEFKVNNFVDRPIIDNVPNPDDRPLPKPHGRQRKWSEDRLPVSFTISSRDDHFDHFKHLKNPEHKALNQSSKDNCHHAKPIPTMPRHIKNPDEKLLPPPLEVKPRRKSCSSVKSTDKCGKKELKQPHTLKENMIELGEKVGEKAQQLGEKMLHMGKKAEQKIEEVVEQISENKMNWLNLAIAGSIVFAGVSILRA